MNAWHYLWDRLRWGVAGGLLIGLLYILLVRFNYEPYFVKLYVLDTTSQVNNLVPWAIIDPEKGKTYRVSARKNQLTIETTGATLEEARERNEKALEMVKNLFQNTDQFRGNEIELAAVSQWITSFKWDNPSSDDNLAYIAALKRNTELLWEQERTSSPLRILATSEGKKSLIEGKKLVFFLGIGFAAGIGIAERKRLAHFLRESFTP